MSIQPQRAKGAMGRDDDVESLLKSLYESLPMMMGVVEITDDDDIVFLSGNAATGRFFGVSPKTMRRRRAADLGIPRPVALQWIGYCREAERTGRPVRGESLIEGGTGESPRWLGATVSSIGKSLSGNSRFSYAAENITGRKKAEAELERHRRYLEIEEHVRERAAARLLSANEQLRETQRQQRALLDSIPDIAWLKDKESRFIAVNHPFGRACGVDPADLVGKTDLDIWPKELAEAYRADDRLVMESRRVKRVEEPLVDSHGIRTWIETIKVPILGEAGEIVGTAGIARDVTQRRQAEEALRETTRTLQELVQASPVGISVIDPEGKVILCNRALEKILGWTEEEVRERLIPTVTAGQEGAKDTLERLLAGERLDGLELRRARKDGQPVNLRVWAAPIREENGCLRNVIAIFLDVTRLKEMEQIALTQQKMASLGQVAAGIAHEIRNPLSGINLYLHSLERFLGEAAIPYPDVQEKAEAVIAMMKAASTKMESVIQRVLSFSRPGPPRTGPLDVNACIREAVNLAKILLQKTGVRVTVVLQEDLPECRGDMRLLEQVLLNLVTNAAQAMEGQQSERAIEIRSSRVDISPVYNYVAVSVADSGPGIPETLRERIFDPFFTTKGEGTGIGLSITQKIVSDHGGFVRVGTSRLGGALFTIGLPAGDTRSIPAA